MRLFRLVLLCVAGSFVAVSAAAEVEKIATACDDRLCFHWWPKVQPPVGWKQDREQSFRYNFNALAPSGSTFAQAETVMYANAVFKPRVPEASSLASFVEQDQAKFAAAGFGIRPDAPLRIASGKTAASWRLEPKPNGQWERIFYFEEGEYYMVFVISSRTSAGLQANMASFEALVAGYSQ